MQCQLRDGIEREEALVSIMASAALGALSGLFALPHCVAMCGPVAAACGSSVAQSATYSMARLAAYTGLGALVGGVAAPLSELLPPPVAALLLGIAMAIALLLTARRLFAMERAPRRPDVPVAQLLRRDASPARAAVVALGLGLGTGLLPCGALHAGLLIAAGTGSAANGASAMAAFGLVSGVPLLGASTVLRRLAATTPALRRTLAGLLVLGALFVVARPVVALLHPEPVCHG
jgi:sulfite exporter TauE/SafE